MPRFETYTRAMLPLKREPAVTLQQRGTMSMNLPAFAAIGSPDAVELLFDPTDRVIGLRPTDAHSDNAHFVRPSTPAPSGPFVVSAMAFFKVYEIDVPVTRRWPARLLDDVLCVDLDGPSTAVRRGRR